MSKMVYNYKKTYSELGEWIPTLPEGTYNVEVDCTGVAADQFRYSYYGYTSPFGIKLIGAKPNVFFNLKFKLPDTVMNTEYCFLGVNNIKSIYIVSAKNLTETGHMFDGCTNLISIDTSAFTQVTDANSMFKSCSKLNYIDTSNFTKVNNAINMFYDCSSITSIDTSGFTNVTDADFMFKGCDSLTKLFATNDILLRSPNFNKPQFVKEIFTNKEVKKIIEHVFSPEVTYYDLKEKNIYEVTSNDDNTKANFKDRYIIGDLSLNGNISMGGNIITNGSASIGGSLNTPGDISGNNAKFNNLTGNLTGKINGDEGKFKTITVDGNTYINDLRPDNIVEKWVKF